MDLVVPRLGHPRHAAAGEQAGHGRGDLRLGVADPGDLQVGHAGGTGPGLGQAAECDQAGAVDAGHGAAVEARVELDVVECRVDVVDGHRPGLLAGRGDVDV